MKVCSFNKFHILSIYYNEKALLNLTGLTTQSGLKRKKKCCAQDSGQSGDSSDPHWEISQFFNSDRRPDQVQRWKCGCDEHEGHFGAHLNRCGYAAAFCGCCVLCFCARSACLFCSELAGPLSCKAWAPGSTLPLV